MQYEESPVALSKCHAHVERCIWEVEGKVRTLKAMAEELHGLHLGLQSAALAWAVEYAGLL